MENSYWLKNLNAQIRGQLPLGMIQQASLNGIILRPKPQPESHRIESVALQPQETTTTTTTTTSTTTPPPDIVVTLNNGEGGSSSEFDVTGTTTTVIIPTTGGTHSLTCTPDGDHVFATWITTAGTIADPLAETTTIDLSTDAEITSVFTIP